MNKETDCQDLLQKIDLYIDNELHCDDELELLTHINNCAHCTEQMKSALALRNFLKSNCSCGSVNSIEVAELKSAIRAKLGI